MCYLDGTCKGCSVLVKSRMAPIKSLSVPRLELVATVFAVKTANFAVNKFEIKFSKVFLWTDSIVVLRYFSSTIAQFIIFDANPVQTLRALTAVEQSHYVLSKLNPADAASRDARPDKI